jgi:hypothetical protein
VAEKRMLIVPAELVKKIDDNRGDMDQAEFIELLIDSKLYESSGIHKFLNNQLKEENKEQKYVTKEEIRSFEQDMKRLLRSFLDFFVSYGLELGKQSPKAEFEELSSKLQELEKDLASEGKGGKATIKWK